MGRFLFPHVAVLAACCFAPAGSGAQEMKIVSAPAIGEESTVGAGGDVYSFMRIYTIDGARIDVDTKAGDWLAEQAVPAGTMLVPVETTKKYKGCVPFSGTFEPSGPCFIDDDGDGRFDRHSRDQVVIFRKLKQPVPYTIVPVSIARADSFKRTILYQGATADSVRFSYREFKDDMARPAFTEELTIPREAFPTMARVKNLQIELLGVSGMGLRYRIVKAD